MTSAFVAADTSIDLRDWTVGELLRYAANLAPATVALKQPGSEAKIWTYAELLADSRRLAVFLLDRFQQGDHVAIWAANSAEWTLYQLAAAQAGLVLVTLNPAFRRREIGALLKQSRSVGLILDPVHRGTDLIAIIDELREGLPLLHTVLRTDEHRAQLAKACGDNPEVTVLPADPCLLLYTSGTTGQPKGVVLRQRGIVNNAIFGAQRYGLPERAAWLGVLPLSHVGGSVTSTLGCISCLGTNIVVPAFEAGAVLKLIEEERIAWLPTVPTMAISMMEHESFSKTDLSSLQIVLTGATTITPDFVRMMREQFRASVQVMFGQTEAGGITKTYRTDSDETIASTVGRPYAHTAVRIADVFSGKTLETGEVGEIRIRSPFMTDVYFDNPEATAAAFDSEGYLRTGDLGVLDEKGYLRITGRLKEMIVRGGENIYPREIEDWLGEFPGVVEAAVVGVPHEKWGEEVAVALRHGVDQAIDVEAVREYLENRIARHKIPKMWKIVSDFPRTATGKIQKFEVQKWFLSEN